MTVFVLVETFNGKLKNSMGVYTDRETALANYEKAKNSYNSQYYQIKGKFKEDTEAYGLWSQEFTKECKGRVIMKGYKTPINIEIRLTCREVC